MKKNVKPEELVLAIAESLAAAGASHTEVQAAVFGPSGIATRLFSSPDERERFLKTSEGQSLSEIFKKLIKEEASRSPGNLTVRVPSSLHDALKRESAREGVSLNQLILSKLTVSLNDLCMAKTGSTE